MDIHNSYLYNQAKEQDYLIIREIIAGNKQQEKVFFKENSFNKHVTDEMYSKAKHYLQITLQNLHYKNKTARQEQNQTIPFEVSVYVSNYFNGVRKEFLIKKYTEREIVFDINF